jgi:acetylornithine deacetylase/succinyl-diaminopimelate desuccinylase-like protein
MKMGAKTDLDKVAAYAQSVQKEYEGNLKKFVDIPSVSMDPQRRGDIDAAAEFAKKLFTENGATAKIVKTRGYPVVTAEFKPTNVGGGGNLPTVTIYNHIDVQPADPAEWIKPPFDMQIDNGVYRGRGSTDDKGPALSVLYAAKYAHENGLPLNIKFIWELEEEIGSPNFEGFLKDNLKDLGTDSVVVSDTIWVSRERPAIPYGLRGMMCCLFKLKTGAKDVHSGLTGGLARNPVGELAKLISLCYDAETGEVKIPGFYDHVSPVDEDELENFVKSGFSVEKFRQAHELSKTRTDDARDGAARIWARPTFEVHGITGGYSGPGVKTIVPHQAEAKISTRLVPNQDPDKIFEAVKKFVAKHAPDVEVVPEGSLKPFLGEFKGPFADAAAAAMKAAFGAEPAFTREGGSIGAVVSMQEHLKVPIVFLGLSLPEHGYHAINENFDWQQASGGLRMFVEYFELISKISKS